MGELLDVLNAAKGAGSGAAIVAVWLLWRIDKSLALMRTSNDVLTETLIRLVPGFRQANSDVKKEMALRNSNRQNSNV